MIKKFARVEGYPNLIRDLDTNAIINTDSLSATNYDNAVSSRKKQKDQITEMKNDLDQLKNSIEEIKSLLRNVLNEPR